MTPKEIQEAREWLADSNWRDVDEEFILNEASDHEIEAVIFRHYAGEVSQFLKDGQPISKS